MKQPPRIKKFTWRAEDVEVEVTEEVTTTANTLGTVRPLGDDPLRQQFPEKTPKKTKRRRKKLAAVATALINLTK